MVTEKEETEKWPVWINWDKRIVSFQQVSGFEQLEYPTQDEMFQFAIERTMEGFSIQYQWMIEVKEISEPIGSISVVHLRDEIAEAEIGYCIGQKWWHKGIMTEALTAVIDYLFVEVGMNRITAKHDTNNPHSGGVMKKCGMQYEGIHRAADRNNQGVCDISQYAILREDWNNRD